MNKPFGHAGHLVRVAALFAAGVAIFFVLQALMVPKGFGAYGFFRAGALDLNRERPLAFAGRAACLDCHSDVGDTLAKGHHAGVHCEACHGSHAAHAADPSTVKAVRPDSRVLCARCHQALVGRPAAFPQVDVADHAAEEACTTCHAPHSPTDAPDASEKGAKP
jgi:predicted CXXCH cytochrome family protein